MARMIDVDDVMGIHEIAALFGVSIQAVINWQSRGVGFPDPAISLEACDLWNRPDVIAWGVETRRCDEHGQPMKHRGGRPRKEPAT